VVHDEPLVKRLQQFVHLDWSNSHTLDLSDAGLLADLAKEEDEAAMELALDNHKHHNNHSH
jgi:hypothetical protein